jgi:UDP-3-O-[3-hydroxymyristoyl] glucosamine N-acyltransferase
MITIGNIINFLDKKNLFINVSDEILNMPLTRPAAISDAQPGEITFCGATVKDPGKVLSETHASLLIMDKNISVDKDTLSYSGFQAIILSDNARLDFIQVVERFFEKKISKVVHPSAITAPSAIIGPDVNIGPFCTIGENVEIGQGTIIHAGVHIYDHVKIGRNVIIHSGCVIGSDGFGFERTHDNKIKKFPHLGSVIIEDEVELQACCHVSKGTLGSTVIKKGTKCDSGCHIAHNVQIGHYCLITAHTMIAGGVKIGDYVWIGASSAVMDRITIGSNVTIGLASVVTKDIPDDVTVMGSPAREVLKQKQLLAHWNQVISKA